MKIEIYIPTIKNDTKIKGVKTFRKEIECVMSTEFGGCTTVKGFGNWVDGRGNLISERVYVITSYCGNLNIGETTGFISRLATYVKKNLQQDCVAYVIDNNMVLV